MFTQGRSVVQLTFCLLLEYACVPNACAREVLLRSGPWDRIGMVLVSAPLSSVTAITDPWSVGNADDPRYRQGQRTHPHPLTFTRLQTNGFNLTIMQARTSEIINAVLTLRARTKNDL